VSGHVGHIHEHCHILSHTLPPAEDTLLIVDRRRTGQYLWTINTGGKSPTGTPLVFNYWFVYCIARHWLYGVYFSLLICLLYSHTLIYILYIFGMKPRSWRNCRQISWNFFIARYCRSVRFNIHRSSRTKPTKVTYHLVYSLFNVFQYMQAGIYSVFLNSLELRVWSVILNVGELIVYSRNKWLLTSRCCRLTL